MSLEAKHRHLANLLEELPTAVIAFSGGVDSTLLLRIARDSLGRDRVLALTATSAFNPPDEVAQSRELAASLGVRQELIAGNELELPEVIENGPQRCYHCKRNLFRLFLDRAAALGHTRLLDGSNLDDLDDYRPGRLALEELRVRSPLIEAGFNKQDIRSLSRRLGLPNWNKPAFACLATRFPYGTRITREALENIARCEEWLREQGFSCYRVRCHDQLARIEVAPEELDRLFDKTLRERLIATFQQNGFDYVTVDLQGYRSGSMNATLPASTTGAD